MDIKWTMNQLPKGSQEEKAELLALFSDSEVNKAIAFHESIPNYRMTPLVKLPALAETLKVGAVYLKDESYRFGLNAFKVLGGSFAMAKYLAGRLGQDISELPYEKMVSAEVREKLGEITFVTATDGNHGRGVAWTANRLKQKAVVYMPMGSSETRLANILAEGAEASITTENYDDCVRMADRYAKAHNGVVVQDTAWEGYEEIPAWIMQGYGTMALEAMKQLEEDGVDMPTHVFVQAGVGSLAGAVQGFFAARFGENGPKVIIAEASLADCLYQSAMAKDGKARFVGGEMQTLMAGLACGEPNITGWEILKNYSAAFTSCEDHVAANGMRILAAPAGEDQRVISGESGAVTTGLLYAIMNNPELASLKDQLGLDESSKVLLFSTEGDTDPEMYRDVVWLGRNSKL